MDQIKDQIAINYGNSLTISNGTLATCNTDSRDIIRFYGDTVKGDTLTLKDVIIDGTNIPAKRGGEETDVLRIEGGNVNIIGSTTIILGTATYAIKFGNHASETLYKGGTLTLDTTGNITGKIILMKESPFIEKNVGAGSSIEYHFGKNAWSTYVDGMATDGEGNQLFAARVGDLSETGGELVDDGILYKDLATAEAAAIAASETLTLVKPIAALTADRTFTCALAVASNELTDARISLGASKLTVPNQLTADAFVIPEGKEIKETGAYTYELVDVQTDPIPPVTPKNPDEVKDLLDNLADATALKAIITTPEQYTAFQTWAHSISGKTSADVAASLKAAVSYQASAIAEAHLYTNDPEVKIETITLGDSLVATVKVTDGTEVIRAIEAIKDHVKASTDLAAWTEASATATINTDTGIATITVEKPGTDKGFIKVLVD